MIGESKSKACSAEQGVIVDHLFSWGVTLDHPKELKDIMDRGIVWGQAGEERR